MTRLIGAILAVSLWMATPAIAQLGPSVPAPQRGEVAPTRTELPGAPGAINPLRVLEGTGNALNGVGDSGAAFAPGASSGRGDAPPRGGLSTAINVMLLLTVVALVPSIMLMTTSCVRIMVVLALLRQAIGTQSLPPGQVITALALFMTAMIMKPTIDRIWEQAVVPYQNGEVRDLDDLWNRAQSPVRDFMFDQIEATDNWSSLYMILNYRGVDTSEPESITRGDIPTTTLIPAYMLSELKVAFLMGFRVYLPFLVIDMVIASLLISMSMMMLPPVLISLPFKLMLFVLVDGWTLVVGSLLESFVTDATGSAAVVQGAVLAPLLLVVRVRRPARPPDRRGARPRGGGRDG